MEMIFIEKKEGYCLNCIKRLPEVNKISIITPFGRDDRDFELCDECAGMLSDMLHDNEENDSDWEE